MPADPSDPNPSARGGGDSVLGGDPVLALVYENTQALVSMSNSLDAHTRALEGHTKSVDRVDTLLARIATAEEASLAAQRGRWSDLKGAIAVLYSNTILSGAITIAMSMLAIGLALWVLTLLGVDVAQITPWLTGANATVETP